MNTVFVVGGAALDVTGVPEKICRQRDSNIGTVRLGVGGVGKNIAKSLTQYDLKVELITAIGSDFRARMIEEGCLADGISIAHSLHTEGNGATYLSVLDEDGDMLVGINDMGIIEQLTPAFLSGKRTVLNESAMCVLDANLSKESLAYLTETLACPIIYEPVSCAKAGRIGGNIGKCFAVKPNRFEAAQLSGRSCDTLRGVYRAADWFLSEGVKNVFISLGEEGVYWADVNACGLIPAENNSVLDTTGAGDAMCAAIVNGLIQGRSAEACAEAGNHASALVCMQKN